MLQMTQSLEQHTGPPLMGARLPLMQDALQIGQGDAILVGQDGQHQISEVMLCLPTRALLRGFWQWERSGKRWRKDDLKATDIGSLLHTGTFNNLHTLS